MSSKGKDKTGGKSRQRRQKAQQPDGSDDRAQAHTPAPAEIGETAFAEPAFAAFAEAVARHASTGTDMIVANDALEVNIHPNPTAPSGLIGIQTFANAYAGFVMRSFRQTGYFVERLMGVRSLDKAVEVQTEFATQTCANLAAESQNFLELYGRLAQQIFRSWQVFAQGTRSHGAR